MSVYLHHIETAVPETYYEQDLARDMLQQSFKGDRRTQRLIRSIYNHSGIDKRHSVIGPHQSVFYDDNDGSLQTPGTERRNELYTQTSKPLISDLAKRALHDCPGLGSGDVTHVITVSCTGFYAPGPEYHLVRELCLPPTTKRFHLGFMGCYAAFPALRMAQAFCQADPDAVVLVVCFELCTLHLQAKSDSDALIGGSVFADGAAAAIVSAKTPTELSSSLKLAQLETTLTEQGEEAMAWTVGNDGFNIVLSSYVPDILEANIRGALQPLFDAYQTSSEAVTHWGIHPGGRAILDKLQASLELSDEQLEPARNVLRDYGNMSSATVLFVLKEIVRRPAEQHDESVCAMAFGPGLTVESGLFYKNPHC
ncbi:MAG: type III polyketide synthase [Trueperaceae bacterium]|nr:type III polyketide synthase [Trueperaceae bacterium]